MIAGCQYLSRTMHRCVFVQGSVSSHSVTVARVGVQHTTQMPFRNDHAFQAFAANGPNQSFGKAALPWRSRCDGFVANAHRLHADDAPQSGLSTLISPISPGRAESIFRRPPVCETSTASSYETLIDASEPALGTDGVERLQQDRRKHAPRLFVLGQSPADGAPQSRYEGAPAM